MAFSFGNMGGGALSGSGGGGGEAGNVQLGPELEDIQTQAIGFLALAGESKVQLLPSPWPSDNLPPPTSSLMGIASHRGLIAAAGPDCIIVATTESVRKAFEGPGGNFKSFDPQLKIPMPMRVSQLAFTADDSYLVLSAESGGGLAVYEVDALLNGSTQTAFELSTNGEALRALVPNPTREKGELLAVVTVDGNLMMANLKDRAFRSGPNGQVLKNGVSCVSWSTKGKQLVAGLGNGTASQMTPEGEIKAEIPKAPGVEENNHATRQQNIFIFQKLQDPAPPFGLNRSPPHHFLLRLKDFPPHLQDVLVVGSSASTDINLFTRSSVPLTNEKPADKITGVFTMTEMADDSRRAQLPGTSSGGYGDTSPIGFSLDLSSKTTVWKPIPGDDLIDESSHPVPALMVLNNEGVLASWWIIYSESIRNKAVYPGLVVAEGMATPQKPATNATTAPTFGSQTSTAASFGGSKPGAAFGGTGAFGSPSAIGQKQSPWGGPSFGTPSFGAPSMTVPAAKTGTPAFGAPAFGATSTPAFGQAGLPGRQSVWGSSNASSQSTGTAFGQPASLGGAKPVFGSGVTSASTQPQASGGFANFANKGGFAAAAAPTTGQSIFGSTAAATSATGVFGSNNATSSGGTFGSSNTGTGQSSTSTLFGGATNGEAKPASTFGGNKFSLGTTFKADTSTESEPGNTSTGSSSFFGGGFGTALKEAEKTPDVQATVSREADMDTEDTAEVEQSSKARSATPDATSAPAKPSFFSTAPSSGSSIFGQPSVNPQQTSSQTSQVKSALGTDTPASTLVAQASSNPFALGSTIAKPVANPFAAPISKSSTAPALPPVQVKQEPLSDKESSSISKSIPQAPLSPDSRSKSSYPIGESSASASENDAPLPPDFATKPKASTSRETDAPLPPDFAVKPKPKPIETPQAEKVKSEQEEPASEPPSDDVPAGPEDEGDDSDFVTEDEGGDQSKEPSDEGSGEDLGKPDSPTSELNVTPGLTPQSSFRARQNTGADTSPLAKIQKPQLAQSRGLFGEIGSAAPILPPPKGPLQPRSPRSPSPVRSAVPPRMMRPDASRSVSAPNAAINLLGGRKPQIKTMIPSQSTFKTSVEQEQLQEQRRLEARARKEAEETRSLVDDEDEKMQRYLSEDIEGTKTLDEFIAHSDVNRPESADSIPAQVEILYRDINSMIDTLGVNAKALKSFIKGHTEQYKEDRGKEDLEEEESWCLDEIDALSYIVEKELGRELEVGRIQDPAGKVETCEELQKDLIKLRQKHEDIKKIVASHTHPDHIAVARAQPLNAEQAAQQNDLRRNYLEFQKLLSEAEEALTVLRAKVASQSTSGNSKTAAPTVEAIMRTIAKMTSMAEKRSGDVDVLEGQMRKLQFSTTSRESSPAFRTPQKNGNNRLSMRVNTPGTSSTNRLFYTPESNFRGSASRRMGGSAFMMSGSGSAMGTPSPRKKISGYTRDEKSMLSEKAKKQMEVREKLRKAVMQAGVSVTAMPENDDY
ncbi:hypothetical protein ACMFMG_009759 [Clarireedia jacksonii]